MFFNYVDTHCHLDVLLRMDFDQLLTDKEVGDAALLVAAAAKAGVRDLISVGCNVPVSQNAVRLANAYAGVWATVGLHPTDVHAAWRGDIAEFKKMIREDRAKKIVGIGETGIDLFRDATQLELQKDVFKAHIELALEHNLPLVLHIRDEVGNDRSAEHALRVLESFGSHFRGVLHCFQQSQAIATEALARGFMLGVDAPVGYPKNDWLRSIVRTTPLESLVLETDSPFLPPPHLRGIKNVPENVIYIAEQVAQVKGIALEEVARLTTQNAKKLFGLTILP
jgi:TatD DNase family protein